MPGISAIGAYVPKYRLARSLFAQAWGSGGGPGERAVASYDEDTLSLAVNAAVDAINAHGRDGIDAVYFASTTAPYREKSSAALVTAAADLGTNVRTADFGGSLRAGAMALRAAIDAVNGGSAGSVLVVASDTRRGYPKSPFESTFGDAAAAIVVTGTGAVEIADSVTSTNEMADVWRRESDDFVRSWEDRFVITQGYEMVTKAAVNDLLAKNGLTIADISTAAVYGPDIRNHTALMRGLGFDPKTQVAGHLIDVIGNTGAAHTLLMLAAVLEKAEAGQKVLAASYGDGADAFLLDVKERPKVNKGVAGHLADRRDLTSYDRFLAYRGALKTDPEPPTRPESMGAATKSWRLASDQIRLHASKCNQCGMVTHPIQRICYECRSKDDYVEVRLYDKPATIFAFTKDHLAGGPEPPVLNCIAESSEGQARVFSILTDASPDEVKIGMPIEFTFRKMNEAANFHNYYWKVKPTSNGQAGG